MKKQSQRSVQSFLKWQRVTYQRQTEWRPRGFGREAPVGARRQGRPSLRHLWPPSPCRGVSVPGAAPSTQLGAFQCCLQVPAGLETRGETRDRAETVSSHGVGGSRGRRLPQEVSAGVGAGCCGGWEGWGHNVALPLVWKDGSRTRGMLRSWARPMEELVPEASRGGGGSASAREAGASGLPREGPNASTDLAGTWELSLDYVYATRFVLFFFLLEVWGSLESNQMCPGLYRCRSNAQPSQAPHCAQAGARLPTCPSVAVCRLGTAGGRRLQLVTPRSFEHAWKSFGPPSSSPGAGSTVWWGSKGTLFAPRTVGGIFSRQLCPPRHLISTCQGWLLVPLTASLALVTLNKAAGADYLLFLIRVSLRFWAGKSSRVLRGLPHHWRDTHFP